MKKFLAPIIAVSLISGVGYSVYHSQMNKKASVPEAVDFTEVMEQNWSEASVNGTARRKRPVEKTPIVSEVPVEPVLPAELNLKLPFYMQAPFANWDYPWQEACEEASILLVANKYFNHNWTAAEFNDQILKMVDWQNERFGDYWHTTMEQTAIMLDEILGLKTVVHKDPSLEDIKRILARGHFIIIPLDGKALKNPYFKNGGPVYHVVPVKGYTKENGIITHDVGTRRGEDYVYSWEVIDEAFHDYAVPMSEGERVLLEVLPPV
jgi:hypothetical protein